MRLPIAIIILLTTVIAAPQLQIPGLPHVTPLLDLKQSTLSISIHHRPPPEPEQPDPEDDHLHDSSVSVHTYDELELFAKYSSAVYQFLCPRPLGNLLVQSVSLHVLTFTARCSCLRNDVDSSLMYSRTHMGSWCVMTGEAKLLLRFGGAMNLRIWSLVRAFPTSPFYGQAAASTFV